VSGIPATNAILLTNRNTSSSVVAATIAHIVVLNKTFGDQDVTYATWSVSVTDQVILTSSIITACSAQFKPFLDSLRSSGMRLDALTGSYHYKSQRHYGHNSTHDRYAGYGSQTAPKRRSINLRNLTGKKPNIGKDLGASEAYVSTSEPSPDWDATSATSESRIIREVRTFTVTEELPHPSNPDGVN
jgi:hypothetical protein